ncbi:MAG: histidine phosphatase family protein [Chloroflexi bacterium]|nr:histidine phosphatase family protein [Chloroflexota bacterium]
MTRRTLLLLLRHGETDRNAEGRSQGRDDPPLNERGRRQAAEAAEAIAPLAPVAVYSSDASRARDTAAAVASACGLEVRVDPRLAELDHGELDGLTGDELRARYPELLEQWRGPGGPSLVLPGGESMEQAHLRMVAAATEIGDRHGGGSAVVVSHNLALRTLACEALGAPLTAARRLRIDLCSLTIVELRPGQPWAVVALNRGSELAGRR